MQRLASLRKLTPMPSLTEQAYEAIREAIASLRLLPGEAISENSLADQLGISRSPTRQALKLLEHEGLVVTQPQRGTYVTKLNEQEAADAVVMRKLLESWALDEMSAKALMPNLSVLESLLHAQEHAADQRQYMAFLDLDTRFHAEILAGAGNRKAVDLFHMLNTTILRVRSWTLLRPKNLGAGPKEHRAIYEAIAATDWDTVRKLLLGNDDELLAAITHMKRDEPDLFE